jgi:catechol 2,3-dioxygenase-like lactoylglutathione lyase family enzyme
MVNAKPEATAQDTGAAFGRRFGQVCWVVKDIKAAERFFCDTLGVPKFLKMENLNAKDLEGTYNGKPADFVFDLYLSWTGDTMLELIQPVSGQSIYTDYLKKHGGNGVQHVAFMVEAAQLDAAVSDLTAKGLRMISSLTLPVAKVAYFDTYKEIGVATEIIGLTAAGRDFVETLKSGNY